MDRLHSPGERPAIATGALVLACLLPGWLLTITHLAPEWTVSEQYRYGWVVPLLAAYLLRLRLESLPAPGAPAPAWLTRTGLLVCLLGWAMLLPVQEANPEWRLLGWLFSGLAVLASLCVAGAAGGWAWCVHLSFPVLFFLTAVPWPHGLENRVMHDLMQVNAALAAEIMRWLGVAAEVQGNQVWLPQATLSVDEACSGIRSLQGALMTAWFAGEIFALRWRSRSLLLVAGLLWALATNTARTLVLTLLLERGGAPLLDRWHDGVGQGFVGLCLVGILATAWLGRRPPVVSNIPVRVRLASGLPGLQVCRGPAWGAVLLLPIAWTATQAWFAWHERTARPLLGWSFQLPVELPGLEHVEQRPSVRSTLRYSAYSGGRWRDAANRVWVAHYFRWEPGSTGTGAVLDLHDPRVCLAGSGKVLVEVLPVQIHQRGALSLEFDSYWFRDRGKDVFVFNCVAGDVFRRADGNRSGRMTHIASRLAAVRRGERNLGQRRLEVAVWGLTDPDAACAAFQDLLDQRLRSAED